MKSTSWIKDEKHKLDIKIDKVDFINIQNFGASKDSINKVKRQATKWEKILANH